jgi:hypothetical protein
MRSDAPIDSRGERPDVVAAESVLGCSGFVGCFGALVFRFTMGFTAYTAGKETRGKASRR